MRRNRQHEQKVFVFIDNRVLCTYKSLKVLSIETATMRTNCTPTPARVDHDRHATVEVRVDEAALEATIHRLGWRVYGTNQPGESLSLAQAVLAYRSASQVERSFGRLKGRPLSLTPMYVQRDDHA